MFFAVRFPFTSRLFHCFAFAAALGCLALGAPYADADPAPPAPEPHVELTLPANTRLINGTGQLPIIGNAFKAPGFTSQGYIEICEDAGPRLSFIGFNWSDAALTIRSSYKTEWNSPLVRITYAGRNKKLGLANGAEETVVAPHQFYVSDLMPLAVKAGQRLIVRNFVPLEKDTTIGCGIISGSEQGWGNNLWPYGNVTGATDRTLDPELEKEWQPTSDLLCVPFLVAGEGVRKDARFLVAFGDSLTFQLQKDKGGTWFQNAFADTPHANLAIGGDALGNVLTTDGTLQSDLQAARFAIAHYATDVLNFYGHNDIGNGTTALRMLALDKAFCARPEIRDARKWRCTLTPFTHNKPGVDVALLTEADQTPDKTAGEIVAFNQTVRRDFATLGYDGIIEIGAQLATGPDSMFWKPGMANDGTHFGRTPANDLITPEARKVLAAKLPARTVAQPQ